MGELKRNSEKLRKEMEELAKEGKITKEKLREANYNLGNIINLVFEQNDSELIDLLESTVTFKEFRVTNSPL